MADGTLPGVGRPRRPRGAHRRRGLPGTGRVARPAGRSTPDTIWSLASVTKPFTATAVMLLVEARALSLDEPLAGLLLPEFLDAPADAFRPAGGDPAPRPGPLLRACPASRRTTPSCAARTGRLRTSSLLSAAGAALRPGQRALLQQPRHPHGGRGGGRALAGTLGQPVEPAQVGRYHRLRPRAILAPLGMVQQLAAAAGGVGRAHRLGRAHRPGGRGLGGGQLGLLPSLGIPWGGLFSRPREPGALRRPVPARRRPDSHGWARPTASAYPV